MRLVTTLAKAYGLDKLPDGIRRYALAKGFYDEIKTGGGRSSSYGRLVKAGAVALETLMVANLVPAIARAQEQNVYYFDKRNGVEKIINQLKLPYSNGDYNVIIYSENSRINPGDRYVVRDGEKVIGMGTLKHDIEIESVRQANPQESLEKKVNSENLQVATHIEASNQQYLNRLLEIFKRNLRIGVAGKYEDGKVSFNAELEGVVPIYDSKNKILHLQFFGSYKTHGTGHPQSETAIGPVGKYLTEDGRIIYLGGLFQELKELVSHQQIGIALGTRKGKNSFSLYVGIPISGEKIESSNLLSTSSSTSKKDLGDVVRVIETITNTYDETVQKAVRFLVARAGHWFRDWEQGKVGIEGRLKFKAQDGAGNIGRRYFFGPEGLFRTSEQQDVRVESGINWGYLNESTLLVYLDFFPGRKLAKDDQKLGYLLESTIKIEGITPVRYHRLRTAEEQKIEEFEKANAKLSCDQTLGVVPLKIKCTSEIQKGKGPFELEYFFLGGEKPDKTVKLSTANLNTFGILIDNQEFTYNNDGTFTPKLTVRDLGLETLVTVLAEAVRVAAKLSATYDVTPTSGVTPLQTTHKINITGDLGDYTIKYDFNGDGTVDKEVIKSSSDSQPFIFTTAGTFNPKATITGKTQTISVTGTSVNVSAQNNLPDYDSSPSTSGKLGAKMVYDIRVSDKEGDPLTVSLVKAPSGATLVNKKLEFDRTTTAGKYGFQISTSDGKGTRDQSWTYEVLNGKIKVTSPGTTSTTEGTHLEFKAEFENVDPSLESRLSVDWRLDSSRISVPDENGVKVEWRHVGTVNYFVIGILDGNEIARSDTHKIESKAEEKKEEQKKTFPSLEASCSGSPAVANTGQIVTWTGKRGGGDESFIDKWSGTDSLSGTSQVITKIYATEGLKQATYQVTTGDGQEKSANCSINVVGPVE